MNTHTLKPTVLKPMPWNLIAIFPGAVALSFVTSRLKNTTPGILAHWAENSLGLVAILWGAIG